MLGAIATGLVSSNSNYSSYAPYSSSPTQEFGNISTTSSRKNKVLMIDFMVQIQDWLK